MWGKNWVIEADDMHLLFKIKTRSKFPKRIALDTIRKLGIKADLSNGLKTQTIIGDKLIDVWEFEVKLHKTITGSFEKCYFSSDGSTKHRPIEKVVYD